eukprot:3928034-Rhodomonas_salina.2
MSGTDIWYADASSTAMLTDTVLGTRCAMSGTDLLLLLSPTAQSIGTARNRAETERAAVRLRCQPTRAIGDAGAGGEQEEGGGRDACGAGGGRRALQCCRSASHHDDDGCAMLDLLISMVALLLAAIYAGSDAVDGDNAGVHHDGHGRHSVLLSLLAIRLYAGSAIEASY